VPVDVAGSGPRVVRLAAELTDGVTFGVGAESGRLRAMLDMATKARAEAGLADVPFTRSALVTLVPHEDLSVARRLAAGGVVLAGRWSAMQARPTIAGVDEQTRAEFDTAWTSYDMTQHGQSYGARSMSVSDELIDRFAVAGPPDHCIERLRELMDLGLDRIVFHLRIRGATADENAHVERLVLNEVLPAVSTRTR
jgi:5,10-methylenetetrahydromethanopterin reductase